MQKISTGFIFHTVSLLHSQFAALHLGPQYISQLQMLLMCETGKKLFTPCSTQIDCHKSIRHSLTWEQKYIPSCTEGNHPFEQASLTNTVSIAMFEVLVFNCVDELVAHMVIDSDATCAKSKDAQRVLVIVGQRAVAVCTKGEKKKKKLHYIQAWIIFVSATVVLICHS